MFGLSLINEHAPYLLTIIKILGASYLFYLRLVSYKTATQTLTQNKNTAIISAKRLFFKAFGESAQPKCHLIFRGVLS
ncbi:LysE family transporter [Moraxella caviae]|nr:LysE family transporter [Moraxella caviae]